MFFLGAVVLHSGFRWQTTSELRKELDQKEIVHFLLHLRGVANIT